VNDRRGTDGGAEVNDRRGTDGGAEVNDRRGTDGGAEGQRVDFSSSVAERTTTRVQAPR
jgi:hypothetical protein